MSTALNPRNLSGWPYTATGHGITQAMLDAAPGRVLAVHVDATHASKVRLATAALPATHLVDNIRGDNDETVDLRALHGLGAIRDAAGLVEGAAYYVDKDNPGHLSETPNGVAVLRFVGDASAVLHVVKVGGTEAAKNALVYPVGNFTALAVNDAGTGADGAVYKLPAVDALQITLPNKADLNAAEGIWRVRISGDWAALATQTTVLTFTDDTANGVDMGTGLPDDGNEWLDLVFDAANDKWIATSGGDVTLTQVIPTYTLHTEVPANIRLYLIDGTGASAEGLYRKETVGDAPNHIG